MVPKSNVTKFSSCLCIQSVLARRKTAFVFDGEIQSPTQSRYKLCNLFPLVTIHQIKSLDLNVSEAWSEMSCETECESAYADVNLNTAAGTYLKN